MSYAQVLSGLDILQEHKDISEYIKNFYGNGGFMFTRETDPIKIQLSDDMEDLLNDGSHSGSSWGWMMRVIQAVLNGNATKEEIIELDIKQKEEYRVIEEKYRIREELKRLKDEEDRVACVLNNEEKANTPVAGEVQVCEAPIVEEPNDVVEEPNDVVKETSTPLFLETTIVVDVCHAKNSPYRACMYDEYDRKYASVMKSIEYPEEFNIFTQGLMDETSINRNCLLNAIDDYKHANKDPRLSDYFRDNAFNYRPYQQW